MGFFAGGEGGRDWGRTAHEGGCAAPGYADEEEAEGPAEDGGLWGWEGLVWVHVAEAEGGFEAVGEREGGDFDGRYD